MLFCMIPIHSHAAANQLETIYFEDGSYMTVEIISKGARASGSVTGSKPYTITAATEMRNGKLL